MMNKEFGIVSSISHIRYVRTRFSLEKYGYYRSVYDIFLDGKVKAAYYEPNCRKAAGRDTAQVPAETVKQFYADVIRCLQTATGVEEFIDDAGGEMTITYLGGEIKVPRGLGNGEEWIGSIAERFIDDAGL